MEIYKSDSDKALVDWQWYTPSLRNLTNLILKRVPATKHTVLDVGCGTGRVSLALAKKKFFVTGTDVEKRVIDIANSLAQDYLPRPTFKCENFINPPQLQHNQYDVVVCSEVLEHTKDYRQIIDNIYRTLKPTGLAIITVPYNPKRWTRLDDYNGHLQRFTIPDIESAMSQFSDLKFMVTGFPFYMLITRIYLFIIRILKKEHSNEILWEKPLTRMVAIISYYLMRLDNWFSFTKLGETLIVTAYKTENK
jgi:SAM-dependent methyltransferase